MKSLLALGIIVLTAGCATTAKYEETINSWVGSKEIDRYSRTLVLIKG